MQEEKVIDVAYAELLASNLALVLKTQFDQRRKSFVDKTLLPETHPLYYHVDMNTWPTLSEIEDMGNVWHKLPLLQCFPIPEFVDPSQLYTGKSHSVSRTEFIEHLRHHKTEALKSHHVLKTALQTEIINVQEFLKTVNDYGLPEDQLIIGLRAKEREVKLEGRFFALMSWKLRHYFVLTEQLIKQSYLPLFKGLTMADDYVTVLQKLLTSSGQGLSTCKRINYYNHLDYSSWNNHQRIVSNGPVFRVMGQFYGLPNVFYRTHEFFQSS